MLRWYIIVLTNSRFNLGRLPGIEEVELQGCIVTGKVLPKFGKEFCFGEKNILWSIPRLVVSQKKFQSSKNYRQNILNFQSLKIGVNPKMEMFR